VLANPSLSFYPTHFFWIIRKHFAIILAQLKTVVLIKEAIKLSFFKLVWSISICVFDYRFKMARNKRLSSETRQSILVLRNEGYSMRETEDIIQRCVLLPSQNSANGL
jgi:hypothetical protein